MRETKKRPLAWLRERQRTDSRLAMAWAPVCLAALALFAGWFQWMYTAGEWGIIPWVFTLGWSLLLTAVAWVLPGRGRRVYLAALGGVLFALTVVHGVYLNMFRKFFSFGDMAFAGDGFAFLDGSYLMIRKLAVLLGLVCLGLMALAALLTLPGRQGRPLWALIGALAGAGILAGGWWAWLRGGDTMVWDMSGDSAVVYENFTDTRSAMDLLGIYQYTFRDLQLVLSPGGSDLTEEELEEIDSYAQSRPHQDNEMTGLLAGKNLILVQLEAIDTWMVDYMPNLQAVKEESVVFSNHYTPAYITAGTFNTEFIMNTGLFPASAGISTAVYTRNAFPSSLAHLFRQAGYTANSFHGSEGDVYNREAIHKNLGYEAYHSGSDMGMANYTMDSQLITAFDDMTAGDPFFSFVITYSGHGPYGEENPIYLAHADEAQAAATRTDGNYVYAVAHAMETDEFVGELMDALEGAGLLEDTVVVFYADHYNYYMLNDLQNMDIKGVDSINLLQHTDWFIYSADLEPETVEKYTSSLDVLPTLANLFGLEADYGLLAGDDAFSDAGGYVIFNDNTWVGTEEDVSAEIAQRRQISDLLLAGNYWARTD